MIFVFILYDNNNVYIKKVETQTQMRDITIVSVETLQEHLWPHPGPLPDQRPHGDCQTFPQPINAFWLGVGGSKVAAGSFYTQNKIYWWKWFQRLLL